MRGLCLCSSSVLPEIIFIPQGSLDVFVLVGEVVLPSGAEADVPAPKASRERFRGLVVFRAELAVLARIGVLSSHVCLVLSYPDGAAHRTGPPYRASLANICKITRARNCCPPRAADAPKRPVPLSPKGGLDVLVLVRAAITASVSLCNQVALLSYDLCTGSERHSGTKPPPPQAHQEWDWMSFTRIKTRSNKRIKTRSNKRTKTRSNTRTNTRTKKEWKWKRRTKGDW